MEIWEYCDVFIQRTQRKESKGKQVHRWIAPHSDGRQVEGIGHILDQYGLAGWELVSLLAEDWRGRPPWGASAGVESYRGVFKRRAVVPEDAVSSDGSA